ncbi:phosphopantetheine-binding protein [Roseobacter sp. MH60115]|uniref:phosphopantetheine-binding protein n=1 Tax=Roseobacter sp. MH60115 TaxID=2785324 RepID=UPI0018A2F3EB|nr:phosphopantetheine-binding protein [Roseobacter sp. MH60115]
MNHAHPAELSSDHLVDTAVARVCASVGLAPVKNDSTSLTDHGLPSLQMAHLVLTLEELIGAEFTEDELALAHWRSPARIKAMLAQRMPPAALSDPHEENDPKGF